EYAIVQTLEDRITRLIDTVTFGDPGNTDLRWDGERLTPQTWLARFRDQVAPRVVVGVYRASPVAPPQVFYAHADHADLAARIAAAGGAMPPDPALAGAVGCTMFDLPGSEDLSLTVLLSHGNLQRLPAQALVRVTSRADGRRYLGVVTAGPFAEPDSLKA